MTSINIKSVIFSLAIFALLAISPAFLVSSTAFGQTTTAAANAQVHPTYIKSGVTAASPVCSPAGLCPVDILTAYDIASLQKGGTTGTGQTVVIVDACGSNTIANDLKTFDSQFGLPNPTLNVINVQGPPKCSGWDVEVALDVEWSHVMAPGATIDLLVAQQASFTDLLGAWSYSLSNSLGNQISNSWGGTASCGANSVLTTAAKDHVTVLASAGDSLAWGDGTSQRSQSPADCLKVLTVGGTTLVVDNNGNYVSESVWGNGCPSGTGTGGGYVTGVKEPKFESSVKINDKYGVLAKSDVSADANPCTGVWVYDGGAGGWGVVGGTSVSCPLWAGFMADVNQIRTSNGFHAAGDVNPFLYTKVYGVSGSSTLYAKDFHDITTGTNGWPAITGWDPPTGLGSFIGYNLAQTLGSSSGA
jgi:subtilase family serine protease